MAIGVDASVVRFTGATSVASAAFTPPDGSLLVCCVNANTSTDAGITVTVSGGSLTWTLRRESDFDTIGSGSGHASIWTAPVGTGASMTVTVDAGTNRLDGKVYIVTGHDVASPVGAVGGARNTANNIDVGYTSTADNSRAFGCATDWNQRGLPVSTDTEDGADYAGTVSVVSLFKAADTATSGTAVTVNFDGGGTGGTEWMWVAMEVKPAAGAAAVPPSLVMPRGRWTRRR